MSELYQSFDRELEQLNEGQRRAVLHQDGPALVLSGAGSGKTRVLTLRIARLVGEGVDPWRVRAVTFTKKAATEMRLRLRPLVGYEQAQMIRVSTFHSWGLSLLRRYAEQWGLRDGFSVYDPRDCIGVLKRVDEVCSNDPLHAREVFSQIAQWKSGGILASTATGLYADVYAKYSQVLQSHNAVDFSDLICIPWHLLSSRPGVCEDVRSSIRHLLVDEYQDTSPAQFALTQWALGAHRSLFAVGDEDQAIYGWRGADIKNILQFRETFPGAVEIRLEANYRSRPQILEAANRLVAHNQDRLGKTMQATRPADGGGASVVEGDWPSDPRFDFAIGVKEVVEMVAGVVGDKKARPDEIAVLVRTNRQLDEVSRALHFAGVPAQVLGSKSYWDRVELQAAMALLRVLVRPDDNMAWATVFKRFKVGVGPKTVEELFSLASCAEVSVWKVMVEKQVKGRCRARVHALADRVLLLREQNPDAPAEVLWRTLWDEFRGPLLLSNSKKEERVSAFIRQLGDLSGPWCEAGSFLDRVATSEPGAEGAKLNTVTLSTIHRSKGLEWPLVFCPGWAHGIFPGDKVGEDRMEEERRLAYVALTRAQDHVVVVSPRQAPSCFVAESGLLW